MTNTKATDQDTSNGTLCSTKWQSQASGSEAHSNTKEFPGGCEVPVAHSETINRSQSSDTATMIGAPSADSTTPQTQVKEERVEEGGQTTGKLDKGKQKEPTTRQDTGIGNGDTGRQLVVPLRPAILLRGDIRGGNPFMGFLFYRMRAEVSGYIYPIIQFNERLRSYRRGERDTNHDTLPSQLDGPDGPSWPPVDLDLSEWADIYRAQDEELAKERENGPEEKGVKQGQGEPQEEEEQEDEVD
ncbi:hypothetical protein F4859DRAFT_528593 [Xylaria cf. heliscus]|nr:hypothetical protein F4859DRAFT_528593 [Xylaria cf. heliscus]